MGLAFGCVAGPPLLDAFSSTTFTVLMCLVVFGGASAAMLLQIANEDVSIVMTCLCQSLEAFSIMVALLATIRHSSTAYATKINAAERNAFLACVIGFSGVAAAILCWLSDLLYYMNRNLTIFVYLMSSAFPIGYMLISLIFHWLTAYVWPAEVSLA